MKFSIKDYFSSRDQIRSFLQIWSYLLNNIFNGKLHFLCSVRFLLEVKILNNDMLSHHIIVVILCKPAPGYI